MAGKSDRMLEEIISVERITFCLRSVEAQITIPETKIVLITETKLVSVTTGSNSL